MKTQSQLKAAIYNALYDDTILTNNIYWLGRPTVSNAFPLITYSSVDTFADYNFCGKSSEVVQFQLDLYVDPSAMAVMDTQYEQIKIVMEALDYRLMSSPAEFLEETLNKIIRVTRWEIINV